ncbi:hypothetical protein [Paenibacillus lautus]|uniref:hypothetical protein n=1 Tax=Paenibacillus lautus TaxID=1401 RepID=UPI003D2CC069
MLVYYMRVRLTYRIIEIGRQRLRGFDAIRSVLRRLAENTRTNKGIMPSLIAFLSEMDMHCKMPELSRAEFPGDEHQIHVGISVKKHPSFRRSCR